jgi:hypothetical protein
MPLAAKASVIIEPKIVFLGLITEVDGFQRIWRWLFRRCPTADRIYACPWQFHCSIDAAMHKIALNRTRFQALRS